MNKYVMIFLLLVSIYLMIKQYTEYKNTQKINYFVLICTLICFICAVAYIVLMWMGLA